MGRPNITKRSVLLKLPVSLMQSHQNSSIFHGISQADSQFTDEKLNEIIREVFDTEK